MNSEEIIEEAKRRFSIGDVFIPAHIYHLIAAKNYENSANIIRNLDFGSFVDGDLYLYCNKNLTTTECKYMVDSRRYNNVLYDVKQNRWAKILYKNGKRHYSFEYYY